MNNLPVDIPYAKVQGWIENRSWFFKRSHPEQLKAVEDGARQLVNYMQHDLPALKQRQRSSHAAVQDLTSKAKRLSDTIANGEKALRQACTEMGIEGTNIEQEIRSMASKALPALYSQVATTCATQLPAALALYQGYAGSDLKVLPVLSDIIMGDLSAIIPSFNAVTTEATFAPDKNATGEALPEIDQGDGNQMTDGVDATECEVLQLAVVEDGMVEEMECQVPGPSEPQNPMGLDAAAHHAFLRDIYELLAFIRERKVQISKALGSPITVPTPVEPDFSQEQLEATLRILQVIANTLTSRSTWHLISLNISKRYQDQCIAELHRKQKAIDCNRDLMASVMVQQKEKSEAVQQVAQEMAALIQKIKAKQKEVERHISVISNGCAVHLTGEINSL